MIGIGREPKKDNDLFFTCGLIDYIARKTKKRLIKQVAQDEKIPVIDALITVYNSFISPKIDDYNSSVYYENPSYIFESFKEGKLL